MGWKAGQPALRSEPRRVTGPWPECDAGPGARCPGPASGLGRLSGPQCPRCSRRPRP
ncbi:hypothetical protein HMPREF0569_1253 [Micrococcus luteus SK58]|nr:hypothetical protein HMPREF0569_1253 [Micrococcus luteus SK58]